MEIIADEANFHEEEDYGRRKYITTITNLLACIALIDACVTVPLIILTFHKNLLSDTASLISCMHMTCFILLSVISAYLILESRHKFNERLDAIGAWIVVHTVNILANTALVVFELHPDPLVILKKHALLIALIGWKLFFIIVEIIGSLYCFYVIQYPVKYVKVQPMPRHPLFNDNLPDSPFITQPAVFFNSVADNDGSTTNSVQPRGGVLPRRPIDNVPPRPISCISYPPNYSASQASVATASSYTALNKNNRKSHYDSYLSLTNATDARLMRNPCYESELSIDYANNYSPYDDMMAANRNRLSYVSASPSFTQPAAFYNPVAEYNNEYDGEYRNPLNLPKVLPTNQTIYENNIPPNNDDKDNNNLYEVQEEKNTIYEVSPFTDEVTV